MTQHRNERSSAAAWTLPFTEAAGGLAVDRSEANESVDRVSCRLGDASCAGAHALQLTRSSHADAPAPTRGALLQLQRRYGNQYVGQVLRQAKAGTVQAGRIGEGEAADSEAAEMEGQRVVGEAEYPADFVGPLQPGDTRAVPHDFPGPLPAGVARSDAFHPTISVVNPGARVSDCGGYTYKVKWGIPASESASGGWIVQKVSKQFEATDCAGNPVAPVAFDDPAGYPFWEAWQFTTGQNVWVGHAAGGSRHSGDTFSGADYGPGTKGKKRVTGEVKAIVGFTLPAGMTVRNAAPAWALPYTRTEPARFASTLSGAAHTLTSEWDCCPNGTVTKATSVVTNP